MLLSFPEMNDKNSFQASKRRVNRVTLIITKKSSTMGGPWSAKLRSRLLQFKIFHRLDAVTGLASSSKFSTMGKL